MRSSLGRYALWIGLAILFAALPHIFTSGTSLTKMSLMGIMIIFALSYNMLLGQTGMLSFGHAVYYGLAGFMVVHFINRASGGAWPVWLPFVPLIGGLTGLTFGIIFGWVSTTRAGTAFAMISLGLGELVAACSLILRGFFGGEEGITTNRTRLLRLFGYNFGPQVQVYYLIAAWCLICIAAMYAITRTPLGRMSNAVRENPERAQFVGYSTQMVRFLSFCLSGFFAGIAGALAAINFEIMNFLSVSAVQSGTVLLMTYIGGVGHFFGPILGAVLITWLQSSLSDLTGAWMLYFGLLFIFVIMFSPGGIAGWIMLHEPLARAGLLMRLLPAYLLIAVPVLIALAGIVGLIEFGHHYLVKGATDGTVVRVLGVALDTAGPWPWLISVGLLAAGLILGRRLWPVVTDAWNGASAELKRRISA
ncbi:MAG: branched-chain amino acid ABC transporter permease [Alphaproteobacteria bacterium]|nr:branched-chain amino acid ABC transporter permease [Alphaproteobacteria bacterium]